ncbi:Druantia anti-phage system protein DruA [Mycobacterium sp.]|uniref:Druantia anti-phage system protein DruA n=1 Tax=Mycobacterium sp. TaxID=1785 RepID=UPI0031D8987C
MAGTAVDWTRLSVLCSFKLVTRTRPALPGNNLAGEKAVVREGTETPKRCLVAGSQATGGYRYVGRDPTRYAMSRVVCEAFGWYKPDGGSKDMSVRVALIAMAADGLIVLAELTCRRPVAYHRLSARSIEVGPEIACQLGEIEIFAVSKTEQTRTWNEAIACFCYSGCTPGCGAQLRYLAYCEGCLLAVVGFGAAVWALSDRAGFIGWGAGTRKQRLHLGVGSPRYLLCPWVRVPYLASYLLGAFTCELRSEWTARYHYAPVLVESFVEVGRHAGRCYRAANWVLAGRSKSRASSTGATKGRCR